MLHCPNGWMKIKCGPDLDFVHRIFIDILGSKSILSGPFWRSLTESYELEENDTISFWFDINNQVFIINAVPYTVRVHKY
jgi:hypothetical protein